jgi:hypothetical protein
MAEANPNAAKATVLEKDHVKVRVLKHGHDKVHRGTSTNGVDDKFSHGDQFVVHEKVATKLEDRGFVEIV